MYVCVCDHTHLVSQCPGNMVYDYVVLTWCFIAVPSNSNVDLSYSWRLYRPITECTDGSGLPGMPLRSGDDPLVSELVESGHSPFSVGPTSGTLSAGDVKSFVVRFQPEKVHSVCTDTHTHTHTHMHTRTHTHTHTPPSSIPFYFPPPTRLVHTLTWLISSSMVSPQPAWMPRQRANTG